MVDAKTISVYDSDAHQTAYVDLKRSAEPPPVLLTFISRVPAGGLVLDLGCGTGMEAAIMIDHGLQVDAVDASPGMVRRANELYGLDARVATFDDIGRPETYDGVWAHFSLLHAPRDRFTDHLADIYTALKSGGAFHLCMKVGIGEKRDGLGRLYTYYGEDELKELVIAAGFDWQDSQIGLGKSLDGGREIWMTGLGIKP